MVWVIDCGLLCSMKMFLGLVSVVDRSLIMVMVLIVLMFLLFSGILVWLLSVFRVVKLCWFFLIRMMLFGCSVMLLCELEYRLCS